MILRLLKESVDISDKVEVIRNLLENAGIYADVYSTGRNSIAVDIEWGDWKHDHLACEYIIKNHFPECKIFAKTTEEDGSDTYSATHLAVF